VHRRQPRCGSAGGVTASVGILAAGRNVSGSMLLTWMRTTHLVARERLRPAAVVDRMTPLRVAPSRSRLPLHGPSRIGAPLALPEVACA